MIARAACGVEILMRLPAVLFAILVGAVGCGGGDSERRAASVPTVSARPDGSSGRAPTDTEVRRALRLPERVPLRATGDAPGEEAAVVRRWLEALSDGRVREAAALFAIPSRFQNFSSVALIRSARQALTVTSSLPCGARVEEITGADGYVLYQATLTDRPGGACGQGVGGVVRGAVKVQEGRMTEWYRLPDAQAAPDGLPDTPSDGTAI